MALLILPVLLIWLVREPFHIETQISKEKHRNFQNILHLEFFFFLNGISGFHLWAQLGEENTNGRNYDFSASDASIGRNLPLLTVKCPLSWLLMVLPPFWGTPGLHRWIAPVTPKFQAWGCTGHQVGYPHPCLFTACPWYLSAHRPCHGERRPNEELSVWEMIEMATCHGESCLFWEWKEEIVRGSEIGNEKIKERRKWD